ncbi:hypothetical protein EUGRSUZ_F01061 [Eucalyptus grandis]|uniref:Uncharacterized protein n=2 Tax=Eucalyptus grandis TaxID=71139 RepID=A0ACC3KFD4_EUCGR|nr:hypothetical protein EUGRSUZ_F01061 [Eucalyptus grandis]
MSSEAQRALKGKAAMQWSSRDAMISNMKMVTELEVLINASETKCMQGMSLLKPCPPPRTHSNSILISYCGFSIEYESV